MTSKFEDPDNPHDPEELSDPPHLHQVLAVLPHQGDADVVGEHRQEVNDVHRILDKLPFVWTSRKYFYQSEKYLRNLRDESNQELECEPGHVDSLSQHEQRKLLTLLSSIFGLKENIWLSIFY